jgi:hypothetical protein
MSEQHTPGPWIVIERRHPYKDGSKSHIERLKAAQTATAQDPIGRILIKESGKESWFPFLCEFHWKGDLLDKLGLGNHAVYAAPRTPKQPTTCTWTQSADLGMPDTYHAPCGVAWTFTEGGPVENDMHFCPRCGNHITQKGADHEPV